MQHTASGRIPAIDAAKGIGIFCIVLGHVVPNSFVYSLLYAFHVPLFFVLSGLTYHRSGQRRAFFIQKAKRILIPYVIFSLISILIYRVCAPLFPEYDTRLLPNLLGMVYGNTNTGLMQWNRPLWFLPCLFVTLLLLDGIETFLLHFRSRHTQLLRCGFALAALLAGTLLNRIPGLYLPFHLESAVLLLAFAQAGVILRHALDTHDFPARLKAFPLSGRLVLYLALFLIGLVLRTINGHVDIRAHMLGRSGLLMFTAAAAFCLFVLALAAELQQLRLLRRFGLSSMAIMLMHKFPILFFQLARRSLEGI